jgi:hypothetical protein
MAWRVKFGRGRIWQAPSGYGMAGTGEEWSVEFRLGTAGIGPFGFGVFWYVVLGQGFY